MLLAPDSQRVSRRFLYPPFFQPPVAMGQNCRCIECCMGLTALRNDIRACLSGMSGTGPAFDPAPEVWNYRSKRQKGRAALDPHFGVPWCKGHAPSLSLCCI